MAGGGAFARKATLQPIVAMKLPRPPFRDGRVTGITYAIYPPAGHDLPWLAVILSGAKPVDIFACDSREDAEALLRSMRARRSSTDNGAGRERWL
jgi:hypothetical protein